MKTILLLLLGLLITCDCFSGEAASLNATDTRRLAQRAVSWLIHDDWGQPDRQFGRATAKEAADWRSSFSRQRRGPIAVSVSQADAVSDRFIYDPTSREVSAETPPSTTATTIYVRITPHKEAGWKVRVSAGLWFYIQVVRQGDDFVVRRHEATWTID